MNKQTSSPQPDATEKAADVLRLNAEEIRSLEQSMRALTPKESALLQSAHKLARVVALRKGIAVAESDSAVEIIAKISGRHGPFGAPLQKVSNAMKKRAEEIKAFEDERAFNK